MSEKSFNFELSADKGRLEKVFNSVFAATKFSNKEPLIVIDNGILEGFDLSVKALIPYVRCNPSFFIGDVTGAGYFCLTKTFLEKLSKGFSAGTVTVKGSTTLKKSDGRGVEAIGEISIVGENTDYTEPVTLPEFPSIVLTSGAQLDYWPTFGLTAERDDTHVVAKLKLDMAASGVMSIQDIAAVAPSPKMTMTFGALDVEVSIEDVGRYSRTLPIEYKVAPEDAHKFVVNNKYFKRAVEHLEGKVLVSVYGSSAAESAIVFSQKTEDLEYIFLVGGA